MHYWTFYDSVSYKSLFFFFFGGGGGGWWIIQYHINLFDKDKAINLDKAFQLNLFKCALSIF